MSNSYSAAIRKNGSHGYYVYIKELKKYLHQDGLTRSSVKYSDDEWVTGHWDSRMKAENAFVEWCDKKSNEHKQTTIVDDIVLTITNDSKAYKSILGSMLKYKREDCSIRIVYCRISDSIFRLIPNFHNYELNRTAIRKAIFEHYSEEVYGYRKIHPNYPDLIESSNITSTFTTINLKVKKSPKKETFKMINITHTTKINGTDIAELSDDTIIETISTAEKEIERLTKIKVTSKKVVTKIKTIQKSIDVCTKLLDARP